MCPTEAGARGGCMEASALRAEGVLGLLCVQSCGLARRPRTCCAPHGAFSHLPTLPPTLPPTHRAGEYWDALTYDWDGTPTHNQDAHRQRTVNWINAAGGLATAFGERRHGRGGGAVRCPAAPPLLLAAALLLRCHCCLLPLLPADKRPRAPPPPPPPVPPAHPQTSPPRASCTPCSSAASTGGSRTAPASRQASWAGGPRAPSPSWRTTTRCAGGGGGGGGGAGARRAGGGGAERHLHGGTWDRLGPRCCIRLPGNAAGAGVRPRRAFASAPRLTVRPVSPPPRLPGL